MSIAQEIIENQSMNAINVETLRDVWPGCFMELESKERLNLGQVIWVRMFAWYELTSEGGQPRHTRAFIIEIGKTRVTYCDMFSEAMAVWNYFMEQYPSA